MTSRERNWTWVEFFKEGYISYDIFNLLRNENRALSGLEIAQKVGKDKQKDINYQLDVLVKRKLIFKSEEKIKHLKGWPAHLYATSKRLLADGLEDLARAMQERPYDFAEADTFKQKVLRLIKDSDMGYTPIEILIKLGNENPDWKLKRLAFFTTYKLYKEGHVLISPFRFPNRVKDVSNVKTLIYGRDKEAIWKGIDRLMPKEVKVAVSLIRFNMEVFPSWILREKSHIASYDIDKWLKEALYKVGIVDFKTVGNDSYFFNPNMPQKAVHQAINGFLEERRKYIAKITSLGQLFEKKAIFTFVEYIKSK
ncbi:hypothetical protein HYX08_02940 [Candidatus Woesearchaeota archaeon]|nr:hypothetical protein [Candidatus Woesearchaeota archaeon]